MNNIKKLAQIPLWLFFLLSIVLVFRIPSFFEPYSYGDEMIYLTLGEGVRQGKVLYRDIHDNKPPLLYFAAAVAGNLFWFKAMLLAAHTAAVYLFWRLTHFLRPKMKRFQQVSTIVFAILTTLPLLEGNIVNSELFMLAPTIAAFLILLKKNNSLLVYILAGVLFSIATLFKVPAIFDIPVIFLAFLFTAKFNKMNFISLARMIAITAIGFIVPILITFLYYAFRGAFNEYLVAAFLQNVGYLSSFRPDDIKEPFLVRNAPLLGRAAIVAVGTLVLFFTRKNLSKTFLLASIWLLFTLFAVTLSERPYPHYLIQTVPALSLLIGILLTSKTIEQIWVIMPLFIFFAVPVYYKFWYYQTTPYYVRFVKFATGSLPPREYLNSFGSETSRNYAISQYVQSNSTQNDSLFVWGNSSAIYALARRLPPYKYVADYHIKDFSSQEEVIEKLTENLPVFIVVLPDTPEFPELQKLLTKNYLPSKEIEGAVIWHYLDRQEQLIAPEVRV